MDIVPAPPIYRGRWLQSAGPGSINIVDECRNAAVVRCPPMMPGSRVPPPESPYRSRNAKNPADFDWSRESDEELDDPEDLRTRIKRYLHLAPGLDPVLVDYSQVSDVTAICD